MTNAFSVSSCRAFKNQLKKWASKLVKKSYFKFCSIKATKLHNIIIDMKSNDAYLLLNQIVVTLRSKKKLFTYRADHIIKAWVKWIFREIALSNCFELYYITYIATVYIAMKPQHAISFEILLAISITAHFWHTNRHDSRITPTAWNTNSEKSEMKSFLIRETI